MNYLVLDLEMCGVSDIYRSRYKYKHEIIQIGGVSIDHTAVSNITISKFIKQWFSF